MTVNNKSKSRSDSSAAEDWRPSEQQENARALASLGGTEPLLQLIRRRRSEITQSMLNRVPTHPNTSRSSDQPDVHV
jgi:hypothetical protein